MRGQAATLGAARAEGVGSGRQALGRASAAGRARLTGRQSILREMLEVVGAVGYEETTVGMVLGRCGVSERAFELEFRGKEDCYLAAFDSEVERVESRLADAVEDERTWLAKLRLGLGCLLDLVEAERNVARALLTETHIERPLTHDRWSAILERAAAFLDLARFEPRAESPPPIAASAVVAGIYGMLRSCLEGPEESGIRDLLPDLVYYAAAPYFGSEAAAEEMAAARIG